MLRVGLNLIYAHPGIGGGWNYIEAVVNALARHSDQFQYVAYVNEASRKLVPKGSTIEAQTLKVPYRRTIGRLVYEATALNWEVRADDIDCMHWFGNYRIPLVGACAHVVSIHDLLVFEIERGYPSITDSIKRGLIRFSVRDRETRLLSVSSATVDELTKKFQVPEQQVFLARFPIDEYYGKVELGGVEEFREDYELPEKFWLYVAHTYPHKNHVGLLKAYAKLRCGRPDTWPLVLRGDAQDAHEDVMETISRLNLGRQIRWLPRLSKREMQYLYCSATVLVFPSLFEGGGIPVLEAMACGCPVIASNLPSVREFGGNAVRYVEPGNIEQLLGEMSYVESAPKVRTELAQRGKERASLFSAADVAEAVETAYRAAID